MKRRYNYSNGDKIGELTFLNEVKRLNEWGLGNFKCQCGKEFTCRIRSVQTFVTKSCGCKKQEFNRIASTKHAPVEYHEKGIKKLPTLNDVDIKRFWGKVSLKAPSNNCWEWLSFGDRYGYFKIGKADYKANRMAYFLHYGVDPAELCVMHSCDNPKCCNPVHLSLGTHWDNMQDMAQKGRARNQTKYSQNEN